MEERKLSHGCKRELIKKLLDKLKTPCYYKHNERQKENTKQMNKDAKRDTVLAVLAILIFIVVAVLETIL